MTRQESLSKGLKTYFTGKPCKRGHISERLLNCMCIECKKEDSKNFRENNKETIKKYNREYARENYSTEKRRKSYQKNIISELYNHAKQRAKDKNLEFNITKNDILIPELCPVFGSKISFNEKISFIITIKSSVKTFLYFLLQYILSIGYLKDNFFCDFIFLTAAVALFFDKTERGARRMFMLSILYLFVVLAALILDHGTRAVSFLSS